LSGSGGHALFSSGRPEWPTGLFALAGVGLVAGAFACSSPQNPVSDLPDVKMRVDLTPTPDQPAEPIQATEADSGQAQPAPPLEAPGRQGPGQGPYGRAPDPPALRASRQYELEFRYARGEVQLAEARLRTFARPVVSPRRLGRFAVELWIGLELVERVRFDFPLLGAEESPGMALERGLVTTQRVLVPATDRPTRAVLVDRATGQEIELRWPPVQPEQAPSPTSSAPPSNAAPPPNAAPPAQVTPSNDARTPTDAERPSAPSAADGAK
jgi:hypothetical protein